MSLTRSTAEPDPGSAPAVPGHRVVRRLGRGATGEVWLAEEESTGDRVALKRVCDGAGPEARARIRREAAVLAQVRHEHVVRLRALHTLPDGLVLVLEHAAAGSLADLVAAGGPLSGGELVTVAAPLAQALAYVHARGIVHGDVAPGNVLVSDEGRPLLADLGVARLVGEEPGEAHGTQGFTDPEVLAGAEPGFASDVFSLGALCRWALGPDGLAAAPAALREVVEAACAPDADDRPDAALLAGLLLDSCRAFPLRLPAPGPPDTGPLDDVASMLRRPTNPAGDLDGVMPWAVDGPTRRVSPQGPPAPAPPEPARRVHRRAVVVGGGAGVLVLGLAAGLVLTGIIGPASQEAASRTRPGPSVPPAPAPVSPSAPPVPRPAATDWADVLGALYDRRAVAFATGSLSALEDVYAPGSPDLSRNAALLGQLHGAGAAVPDLRIEVVTAAESGPGASGRGVVLDVVDTLDRWTVTDLQGAPLGTGAGRGWQRVRVELVPAGEGWLIATTRAQV